MALLAAKTVVAVPADLKDNYQPIIDRNPFGLRPPPPPPTNNVAAPVPEKPKTEIFLTGIISVGHPVLPKKVFLKTQAANNKKEEKFYDLQEGQEMDGIKILSIDEVNRKVRVMMDNGETLLTFQTHGVAPPAAPAMALAGQPGAMPVPGQPGAPPPLPNARQGGANAGGGYQPSQYPQGQPAPINASGTANPQNNFRSIPSRSIRSRIPGNSTYNPGVNQPGNTTGVPQSQQQQAPPVDPAEQYLRMHLDKVARERQGLPMPPLPPIQ